MLQIKKLLPLLREHGVASFKFEGLEITFHKEQINTKDHVVPMDEQMLPPDLRTDGITDSDKTLFWSGSPDTNSPDAQLPLTGDAPFEP